MLNLQVVGGDVGIGGGVGGEQRGILHDPQLMVNPAST
jgi:hypothetical protein